MYTLKYNLQRNGISNKADAQGGKRNWHYSHQTASDSISEGIPVKGRLEIVTIAWNLKGNVTLRLSNHRDWERWIRWNLTSKSRTHLFFEWETAATNLAWSSPKHANERDSFEEYRHGIHESTKVLCKNFYIWSKNWSHRVTELSHGARIDEETNR